MKPFHWMKENPIKASTIILPFVIGCFFLDVDHDWIGWPLLFVVVIGLAALVFHKHFWVSLLVFSLATEPVRAVEQPQQLNSWGAPVAVTVVVCAALYCVYRIGKFCQKKFGKSKPANTNELYSAFGGVGDEYGGSWNHGSLGSCLSPDATGKSALLSGTTSPTLFSLNVFVASPTELRRTMTADTRPESFQSWVQFQSEVASHGLWVSGQNDGSQYFSKNGVPVSAGEVPLRFDTATGQVIHDRGGQPVQIAIEASSDLEHWQRLASVVHGVGEGFQIADVSEQGFQFYRVLIAP